MKSIIYAVAILFSLFTGAADNSKREIQKTIKPTISVQPYLQNPIDGGVTIMWETAVSCYSWVEYGTTEKLGQKAETIIDGMRQANNTRNRVRVANLKPAQKYFYRVCGKTIKKFGAYHVDFGENYQSEIFSFTTLAPNAPKISCVIFNDLHDNRKMFGELAKNLDKISYDFSMFNGDIFNDPYKESVITDSLKLFNTGANASNRPIFYIRGNHEYRGPYARLIKNHFDLPNNNFFYAFTHGGVRFIFLDCGEDKEDSHWAYSGLNDFSGYREKQLNWLKKEVKSDEFKNANFRVVIHHIPLYTRTSKWISTQSKKLWEETLNLSKIDLAICGHTHQSDILEKNTANNPYPVVIGGGKNDKSGTIIKVDANSKSLRAEIIDINGNTLLKPLIINK